MNGMQKQRAIKKMGKKETNITKERKEGKIRVFLQTGLKEVSKIAMRPLACEKPMLF